MIDCCLLYLLCCQVSPWAVEPDREESRKAEEAARKQAEAEAVAEASRREEAAAEGTRAAGIDPAAARQQRRRAIRIQDFSGLAGAVEDDDEYDPMADSDDSEERGGRRRGRGMGWIRGRGGRRGRAAGSDDDDYAKEFAREQGKELKKSGRGGGAAGRTGGTGLRDPWTVAQVQQQQQIHLHIRQQQMLAAVMAGNPAVLAQLSSVPPNTPPQDQPFPVPLRPVSHQLGCCCCRMPCCST